MGYFGGKAVDASVNIPVPISVTVGRSITMDERIGTLYALNSRLVFQSPLSYFQSDLIIGSCVVVIRGVRLSLRSIIDCLTSPFNSGAVW